jgi:anti-sigma factor RsiW
MTQCIGSPAQEMAEQYLAGGLPEQEAERFEDHYFACDLCHEYLLALTEIRDGLAREPIDIAAPAPSPNTQEQGRGGRLLMFPARKMVWGSMAAALILGTVLVGIRQAGHISSLGHDGAGSTASAKPQAAAPNGGEPNPSAESKTAVPSAGNGAATGQNIELASLADLRMPGYQQPQLRGEGAADTDHVEFLTGMRAYAQGDCDSALEHLAVVPATASNGVAAQMYSGLCQLKGRELDQAQASFEKVAAAGDTPELETAEYFLAQTRLLRGDAAGATKWLNKTITLRGDYEERAQKQLARLAHTEQLKR